MIARTLRLALVAATLAVSAFGCAAGADEGADAEDALEEAMSEDVDASESAIGGLNTASFRSPTGKVHCLYTSGGQSDPTIRCDWLGADDESAFISVKGKGAIEPATDTIVQPNAKVLKYGTKRYFNNRKLRCTSHSVTGITCMRVGSGHGISVSQQRQKAF